MALVGTDCGYMSVHSVARPKARKQYHCGECGCKIMPGETYRRDFMVWDGEAGTHITCSKCDALINGFFSAIPKDYRHEITFEFGGLREAIVELRNEYGATIEGFEYPEDTTP